jgi:hypothetical protein
MIRYKVDSLGMDRFLEKEKKQLKLDGSTLIKTGRAINNNIYLIYTFSCNGQHHVKRNKHERISIEYLSFHKNIIYIIDCRTYKRRFRKNKKIFDKVGSSLFFEK